MLLSRISKYSALKKLNRVQLDCGYLKEKKKKEMFSLYFFEWNSCNRMKGNSRQLAMSERKRRVYGIKKLAENIKCTRG